MTKKEIIEWLIVLYEGAISEIKRRPEDTYEILHKYGVDSGVCLCAELMLGVSISSEEWVVKYMKTELIWDVFPYLYENNPPECIRLLEVRLNNLQTELQLCK